MEKNRKPEFDYNFLTFMIVATLMIIFFLHKAIAAPNARDLFMSDKKMEVIRLSAGRSTVLSFPVKPTKVILGAKNLFSVEYVENDLAIAPLSQGARTNLFVYLLGRRFSFDLVTVANRTDDMVIIKDLSEKSEPGKKSK